MILLIAVLAGALSGWGLSAWQGRPWHPPVFRYPALAIAGFLPQVIAFYLPATSRTLTDKEASACLILSQILLLGFAGRNISLPGMPILFAGLGCNLAVILANGGFMPLMAETAERLVSHDVLNGITFGERIGYSSKDILLPGTDIRFPWLADRFISPSFLPFRSIFSTGDIFIAIGAFILLLKRKPDMS